MSAVAIIQARMTSTRLPGKVLLPLGRRTVLDCVIDRVSAVAGIDKICIAIPEGREHDAIVKHFAGLPAIAIARGPEHDVLARFIIAARQTDAIRIVRVTSDCPMIDPAVISAVLAMHQAGHTGYAATSHDSGFPIGCDCEIVTREVLETADREATDPYEREHVMPFIWRRPERFPALYLDRKPDLRHLRLTVDAPADYELAKALYARLGSDPLFGIDAVERVFAKEPALRTMNGGIKQTPYVYLQR
jgi:spore coat polysaccharide biosynthesis protein SpsF